MPRCLPASPASPTFTSPLTRFPLLCSLPARLLGPCFALALLPRICSAGSSLLPGHLFWVHAPQLWLFLLYLRAPPPAMGFCRLKHWPVPALLPPWVTDRTDVPFGCSLELAVSQRGPRLDKACKKARKRNRGRNPPHHPAQPSWPPSAVPRNERSTASGNPCHPPSRVWRQPWRPTPYPADPIYWSPDCSCLPFMPCDCFGCRAVWIPKAAVSDH